MAVWGLLEPLQTPIDWFAAWWVWVCFASVAALVIFIFVAVWLYKDAQSRGMSGGLWVVLLVVAGFFLPFIGGIIVLAIYLIMRMEHPVGYGPAVYPPAYPPPPGPAAPAPPAPPTASITCKSCGAPLPPTAKFCSNCGTQQ